MPRTTENTLIKNTQKTTGVIVIGTGGHARVILSLLQRHPQFKVKGLLDLKKSDINEKILGYPVIGSWDDVEKFFQQGIVHAILAVGDNKKRSSLFARLKTIGFQLPILIHPQAYLEPSASVGEGTVVCAGAILGTAAQVGEGVILNTRCIVDHECEIQSFVHVAPGTAVAGRVRIGEGTFIGIGSSVKDRIHIGNWATIGAGSVVIDNIPDGVMAIGVPARVKK